MTCAAVHYLVEGRLETGGRRWEGEAIADSPRHAKRSQFLQAWSAVRVRKVAHAESAGAGERRVRSLSELVFSIARRVFLAFFGLFGVRRWGLIHTLEGQGER